VPVQESAGQVITVQHVVASLAEIDTLVQAVRSAISGLDPNQELHLSQDLRIRTEGPILTGKNCRVWDE
jgi:hypothetical protein